MGERLHRLGMFALLLPALTRRALLNLTRYLPGSWRYFRCGWCNICGEFGWVFYETGEHESCWLELK